jgi:hypothetical protein
VDRNCKGSPVKSAVLPQCELFSYRLQAYELPDSPGLLAKNIPHRVDPETEIKFSEYLAAAWKAANDKARELGWIV